MATNCQSAETWEWQFYHGFLGGWIITIICFLHTASRISLSHATRFLHSFRGALMSAQPCLYANMLDSCVSFHASPLVLTALRMQSFRKTGRLWRLFIILFMFSFGSVGVLFFCTCMHILCLHVCMFTCVCACGGDRLTMVVFFTLP